MNQTTHPQFLSILSPYSSLNYMNCWLVLIWISSLGLCEFKTDGLAVSVGSPWLWPVYFAPLALWKQTMNNKNFLICTCCHENCSFYKQKIKKSNISLSVPALKRSKTTSSAPRQQLSEQIHSKLIIKVPIITKCDVVLFLTAEYCDTWVQHYCGIPPSQPDSSLWTAV